MWQLPDPDPGWWVGGCVQQAGRTPASQVAGPTWFQLRSSSSCSLQKLAELLTRLLQCWLNNLLYIHISWAETLKWFLDKTDILQVDFSLNVSYVMAAAVTAVAEIRPWDSGLERPPKHTHYCCCCCSRSWTSCVTTSTFLTFCISRTLIAFSDLLAGGK